MKNVYDHVQVFYDAEIAVVPTIKREWVEGFLRQRAWQGVADAELQNIWHIVECFMIYLAHSEFNSIDELEIEDYRVAIEWMGNHIAEFTLTLESVKHFFDIMQDFYRYLADKRYLGTLTTLESAAQEIAGGLELNIGTPNSSGDELKILEREKGLASDKITILEQEQFSRIVSQAVEKLMLKLGKYFQRDDFTEDFDRALALYTGPIDAVPTEEYSEFWLGFWDYFLFDYHLLSNDIVPLLYFYNNQKKSLTPDEKRILQDLLNSQFTVFYINRIINREWVECTNLFTEECFQLPFPDFDYSSLKKMLFFGHICNEGIIMVNYITSIEVSSNLRKRIKEEVFRQKELFAVQSRGASLKDFFDRHSLVVRHTITILVSMAKVNVTSISQLERSYPAIQDETSVNNQVVDLVCEVAREYGLSQYDKVLMERIWQDFCSLEPVVVRKKETWVAAIIYIFAKINDNKLIILDDLVHNLKVTVKSVFNNSEKIWSSLQLERFDARYLNEEGFIMSIYNS